MRRVLPGFGFVVVSLVVALVTLAAIGGATATDVPFTTKEVVASSVLEPSRVALADFDRDGDLDLLVAGRTPGEIAWFENLDGNGTFSGKHAVTNAAPGASAVLAADLDRDGLVDVAYTSSTDALHVAWLRNLGGGRFDASPAGRLVVSNSAQSLGARSLAAGDVDRDGDPDLLVAAETASRVLWYRNPGNPGSGNWTELPVSSASGGPRSAVFADIDRDGDPDVFVAAGTGVTFSWYENKGNDGFAAQQPIWTGSDGRAVAAGDLNGDGEADVVAASCADNTVAWFANDDDTDPLDKPGETFPVRTLISSAAGCPAALVVADLDLDADADVVVASSSGALRWFENLDGAGRFGPERLLPGSPAGAADLFVADLDADGDPDVAAAATSDDEACWFENRTIHRSGLFPEAERATIAQHRRFAAVALADTNRDGRLDVITAAEDRVTSLFLNGGGGTFEPEARLDSAPFAIRKLGTGDIDRDGDPDVVLAGDELTWLDNDPAQATWTRRQIDNAPQAKRFESVAVSDVDRDGRVDVVSGGVHSATGEGFVHFYRNTPGSGNGVNWDQRVIATGVGTTYAALAARDVDGDGLRDVVTGGTRGGTGFLGWHRNGGDAGFGTERPIAAPAPVRAAVLADVDLDGDPDVVFATDGAIAYYANADGAGGAWEFRAVDGGFGGASLAVADVDNDGDPDIAAGSNAGSLRWVENRDGAGRSWRTTPIQEGTPVAAAAAGDIDREGDADLVVASGQNLAAWFPNRGGQVTFGGRDVAPAVSWSGIPSPMAAATVRLNARLGDSVGRLKSITVQLYDGAGMALTAAQASLAVATLRVYRDDGSNTFDVARDVLVARVAPATSGAGIQTIALPPADASARIAAPATFFVALEFADAAGGARYALRYLASSTVVVDGNADREIVLTAEPAADVLSGVTRVRVPIRVNGVLDEPDALPGNGECRSIGGSCTLRAAVQEANATAQPDLVLVPAGEYRLTIAGTDDNAGTGDLDLAGEITLQGAGAGKTFVAGQLGLRTFQALGSSNVTLQGLSFRGGGAEPPADLGGCLYNTGGVVRVLDSDFVGCTAAVGGGAFADTAGAVTTLDRCALYRNEAPNGSAGQTAGAVTLRNTTVSTHRTTASGSGAGTLAVTAGSLTGASATIAGNDAVGVALQGGAASLANTVVAVNTGGDLAGPVTLEHCFIGTLSGDPRLGPLGDNEGPTYTHAPLPGSPLLDAGACPSTAVDQRGFPRPVDIASAPNAGDACDIGAVEATIGQSALRLEIPVRWCALRGAPSIENPTLVGALTPNDVVRARHEAASQNVFEPLANIRWRSAGNFVVENIPLLEDPDCTPGAGGQYTCARGQRGDVYINPEYNNFDEFQQLIAECRAAWQAQDPRITGITAVHINRFVGEGGAPLEVLGLGGRAAPGDRAQQEAAGRVMVVDGTYRRSATPPDTIERLLAHELGHALSLEHGDGLDNDANRSIDDDDDRYDFKPRFDGPNVMQYRTGTELTGGQIGRLRTHALLTIPDLSIEPPADLLSKGAPLDPGIGRVLDFGFGRVLDFGIGRILDFGIGRVLDFGVGRILDFQYDNVQDFGIGRVLDFGFGRVLDFGMDFGSGDTAGTATLYAATAGLPWSPPIRPASSYSFYLDLDESDATGGAPAEKGFPPPPAGQELGVDIVAQVTLSTTCPDQVCYDAAELRVYDYDDATGVYDLVLTQQDPALTAVTIGLLQETGETPAYEDVPIGLNVRPSLPLSILTGAIPGHAFNPGDPVRMQVVTTVDCNRRVVNDDDTSDPVDCVCTDCALCPDYPGCSGTAGTPRPPDDPDSVVVDEARGRLEFESPALPACLTDPVIAAVGEPVTVTVTELPADVTGAVEVTQGATQLSAVPSSAIDPLGTVLIPVVPLPPDQLGVITLSAGLVGYAPRAQCEVTIDPNRACRDTDGDGACDYLDPDDDNDTVPDGEDGAPRNRFVCRDTDGDSCDDCSTGVSNVGDDGLDTDGDGLCDAGDPDADNDGVPNASDCRPLQADVGVCADGNPCTDDVCNATGPTACTFAPAAGRPCDDGNACTTGDACTAGGTCGGGPPPDCNDGNPCTADGCEPATGCSSTPIVNCDAAAPSLFVTVTADPASLTVGDQGADVTFTLAVTNTSGATDPVTLSALTDSRYGNLVSGAANPALKSTGCTLATIAPAASYTCQYVVHQDPSAPGTETNTVTATGLDDDGQTATASGSATVTILPASSMTDSSFCFFDRDEAVAGRQFRVSYTSDPGAMPQYKIASGNPGQFFYTMFMTGTPGRDVQIAVTLPYPFITHSAAALKIYDGIDTYTDPMSGDTCYRTRNLVESRALTVALTNYAVPGFTAGTANTTSVPTITVTMPASGFLALRLHLDYGLEGAKVDGNRDGKADRYDRGANDDALLAGTGTVLVPEGANHVFSFTATGGASGSGTDTLRNDNRFKGSAGVQGTVEFDDGRETPAANVLVELWGPNGLAGSARTDANGVYVINYRNPNKQATFDVYTRTGAASPPARPGTADGCYRKQSTTLRTNAYQEVNFLDETNTGPDPSTCVPPPS